MKIDEPAFTSVFQGAPVEQLRLPAVILSVYGPTDWRWRPW